MANIYYEPQRGGLCRLHAINAFFGGPRIDERQFNKYIADYDSMTRIKYNIATSARDFDLVGSDQCNLVGYILRQHRVFTRYYALGSLYKKEIPRAMREAEFFFVYNAGHIWGIRRQGGYYKVDSIGGVRPININSEINNVQDIGFIVPVDTRTEFNGKRSEIRAQLERNNALMRAGLERYLRILHRRKEILGELEVALGVAISALECQMSGKCKKKFARIQSLVDRYDAFIAKISVGRYNDIGLILEFVPDLLLRLLSL